MSGRERGTRERRPHRLAAWWVLAAWLAASAPLAAQLSAGFSVASFQFNLSNPGARSLGMGGAFTARADDATAAYANPAGLTVLRRPELSFEGRAASLSLPLVAAEPLVNTFLYNRDPSVPGFDTAVISGASLARATPLGSSEVRDSTASFLSFVYPRERWTFALYRHQLADLEATSGDTPLAEITTLTEKGFLTTRGTTRTRGARVDIAGFGLAAARAFGDRVSVGVTLVRNEASFSASRFSEFVTSGETDLGEIRPFTQSFGSAVGGDDSDITVNLGVHVRPSERWAIGASYRQGASFAVEELEIVTDNEGESRGALPSPDFRVPDVMSVGASFEATRKLIVSLEWDRVRYSRLRGLLAVPVSLESYGLARDPERLDRLGRFVVDDADELRAGLEYSFWQYQLAPAVRLGAWYDPEHKVRFGASMDCPGAGFIQRQGQVECTVEESSDTPLTGDRIAALQRQVADATTARALEQLFPRGEDDLHLTAGFGIVLRDRFQIDSALDYVSSGRYTVSLSAIAQF